MIMVRSKPQELYKVHLTFCAGFFLFLVFFFSFLNLSIKKGKGNSKVAKEKQNLSEVGF